jgi:hypothetical protein
MYVATRSFTACDGSQVRAGISRVSDDHELLAAHPECFEPARSGFGAHYRSEIRAISPDGDRVASGEAVGLPAGALARARTLESELAVRRAYLAELGREEARRTTESLLRSGDLYDLRDLDARLAEALVEEACAGWGDRAPWLN